MNKIIYKKYLLIAFIFGFFICGQSILAATCVKNTKQDCGTCGLSYCNCTTNILTGVVTCSWGSCQEPTKPSSQQTINWLEYNCMGEEDACGQQYIKRRTAYQNQTRTVTCPVHGSWVTGNWVNSGDPYYSVAVTTEYCDLDWQLCSGGSQWSKTERQCSCSGKCLETPANPRYYNNPNYPTAEYDPEESKGTNSLYLPLKIDWDNTKAWKNGWMENGVMKTCTEDCFQSYGIWINNLNKPVTKSEYNPTQDQGACFLKSKTTYSWGVMACCNANGTDCGEHSSWSFNTNSTPEIIKPADPDWDGPEINEDITIPVEFDWCDVPNTKSYVLQIYGDGALEHVSGTSSKTGIPESKITMGAYGDIEYFTGNTNYEWNLASCVNSNGTDCGASCGANESYEDCSDFTKTRFLFTQQTEMTPPRLVSPSYDPNQPTKIPGVNLSDSLEWIRMDNEGRWARSFYYEIKIGNNTIIGPTLTENSSVPFNDLWKFLKLETTYNWHVKSCYDEEGTDCSNFGTTWYFQTTGAKPNLDLPNNNAIDLAIPVNLDWQDVPGANSYKYEVATEAGFTNIVVPKNQGVSQESKASVDYPALKMLTNYWWRVKTCTDNDGVMCGDWSLSRTFKTFKLGTPVSPSPINGADFNTYDKSLSWNPVLGAKAYQYKVTRGGVEKLSLTSPTNSVFIPTERFLELGTYSWNVRSCLDTNCQETGDWGGPWSFNLVQPTPTGKSGLVPCGGLSDYPDTPWNEREQCGIQHIFIMLQNIINFLLWRVSLIILFLLTILTGVIFYFSLGKATTILDVKSLWRSAGIGYAIIFFAWIMVNLILKFFGYTVSWWIITF